MLSEIDEKISVPRNERKLPCHIRGTNLASSSGRIRDERLGWIIQMGHKTTVLCPYAALPSPVYDAASFGWGDGDP
jgi:hypothetical protein